MTENLIVQIICHYDSTNFTGGLEKQTRLLTQRLAAYGESVVLLASTRKLNAARWMMDGIVPVRFFWTYHSPQVSGRYLPASLIWALQILLWLIKNRHRISVIHIQQLRIHAFVAALVHRVFGIPIVLKSATGDRGADIATIGSRKYFGPPGRRFVAKSGGIFVATTKSVKEDLIRNGVPGDHVRLIPNGMVMPTVDQAGDPSGRVKRCLFLGRVAPDKNPLALARAAASIVSRDFVVDFYGTGPERETLESIIKSVGNPALAYRGFVADPSEILPEYGWLLLPSAAEGLSNAMVEAMAHGVVPVTTQVSGCIDHIEEGVTGFFFPGTEKEQMRQMLDALSRVGVQQWVTMSERVAKHAREHFDIEHVVREYRLLYDELRR